MSYDANKFWCKVDRRSPGHCWLWQGYTSASLRGGAAYGRLDFQRIKGVYAHRVAYFLAYPGRIRLRAKRGSPMVLHKCDHPLCCNPRHLYLGDHDQNMRDKVQRGRSPDFREGRGPRCKLTMEDVLWMRMQKRCGATKKALALLYDVSGATVSGALYGRHYAPNMLVDP